MSRCFWRCLDDSIYVRAFIRMSLHWVSKLRRVISRKNSNSNSGTSTVSKHLSSARHRFQRRWWYNKNTWRSLQKNWRLNKTKSFWWVNSQVKPSQSRWTKSRPNITHIVPNPPLFEYSHRQHNRQHPSNVRRYRMIYKRSFLQNKNFLMHKRSKEAQAWTTLLAKHKQSGMYTPVGQNNLGEA